MVINKLVEMRIDFIIESKIVVSLALRILLKSPFRNLILLSNLPLRDDDDEKRRKKKTRTVFSRSQVFRKLHTNLDFQQILHVQVFQLESTFDLKRYLSRLVGQKQSLM